jgi:predicted transcriptional regulator
MRISDTIKGRPYHNYAKNNNSRCSVMTLLRLFRVVKDENKWLPSSTYASYTCLTPKSRVNYLLNCLVSIGVVLKKKTKTGNGSYIDRSGHRRLINSCHVYKYNELFNEMEIDENG